MLRKYYFVKAIKNLEEPSPVDLGLLFHKNTSINLSNAKETGERIQKFYRTIDVNEFVFPSKKYNRDRIRIKLPEININAFSYDLVRAIVTRRSVRIFSHEPVKLNELSALLKLSSGVVSIQNEENHHIYHRPFPTAGGLNSCYVYLISINVKDLPFGSYYYDPPAHELIKIRYYPTLEKSEFLNALVKILGNQEWIKTAGLILIITGDYSKIKVKYGDRSYRYLLLEAGHIMQNFYLIAPMFNLGVCSIGGFYDDDIAKLICVDNVNELVLYLGATGKLPRETSADDSTETEPYPSKLDAPSV